MTSTLLSLVVAASTVLAPGDAAERCDVGEIRLELGFPGSPASPCERLGPDRFRLLIEPETTPINPSPWYAFAVEASSSATVEVVLDYTISDHRYAPWLRHNDGAWTALAAESTQVESEGSNATLTLTVAPGRTDVAAQPLYLQTDYQTQETLWTGPWRSFGTSLQGRPLRALVLEPSSETAGWTLILGRQHPPEIPGAWALDGFVDGLLAARATGRFDSGLIIAPLLNPDGVAAGHWRMNAAGVDLNRDWAERSQPETQAVWDLLNALDLERGDLEFVVDFHATVADRLYLPQAEELSARDADRLDQWLANMGAAGLFSSIEPRRTNPTRRLSAKTAFTDEWSALALTWEAGDTTSEQDAYAQARRGAESWVVTLNEE